jgi:hypothetical protein
MQSGIVEMRWDMESPLKYFAELKDPRVERTREHILEEIVLIAIAAILSGAGGWNEIENYGKARIDRDSAHRSAAR